MSRNAEELKAEILRLPRDELRAFREWYESFDADEWDRQIERDATSGRLDELADAALSDHEGGKSRRL